jgi:hypothetical protein
MLIRTQRQHLGAYLRSSVVPFPVHFAGAGFALVARAPAETAGGCGWRAPEARERGVDEERDVWVAAPPAWREGGGAATRFISRPGCRATPARKQAPQPKSTKAATDPLDAQLQRQVLLVAPVHVQRCAARGRRTARTRERAPDPHGAASEASVLLCAARAVAECQARAALQAARISLSNRTGAPPNVRCWKPMFVSGTPGGSDLMIPGTCASNCSCGQGARGARIAAWKTTAGSARQGSVTSAASALVHTKLQEANKAGPSVP